MCIMPVKWCTGRHAHKQQLRVGRPKEGDLLIYTIAGSKVVHLAMSLRIDVSKADDASQQSGSVCFMCSVAKPAFVQPHRRNIQTFTLQAILKQIKLFVKEFAAGGPAAKSGFDSSTPAKQPVQKTAKTTMETSQPQKQKKKSLASKSRSKFETSEKFYARAKDIYACFTDEKCISAYTQSPSKV